MLFDINSYRKELPSGLIVYASGANRVSEIMGFSRLGIPVGVSVVELNEEAISCLIQTGAPVMVDSGAFSEVKATDDGFVVIKPIRHKDWVQRLGVYLRLGQGLGRRACCVVPDRVGNQAVTLERLRLYAAHLAAIAATGADLLLPMQLGDRSHALFYTEAQSAAGVRLIPAFTMNKGATSPEAILGFVTSLRPVRIHLLGMGISTRRAVDLVKLIHSFAPECLISMDSNRLRAVTGAGRPMTTTETGFRHEEPTSLWGAVESSSLDLAAVRLDYTDMIARPSLWATSLQLTSLASGLRLSLVATQLWLDDPDGFLQTPCTPDSEDLWIDHPLLLYLLDEAWIEYVQRSSAGYARQAAVMKTFKHCIIAGQYDVDVAA